MRFVRGDIKNFVENNFRKSLLSEIYSERTITRDFKSDSDLIYDTIASLLETAVKKTDKKSEKSNYPFPFNHIMEIVLMMPSEKSYDRLKSLFIHLPNKFISLKKAGLLIMKRIENGEYDHQYDSFEHIVKELFSVIKQAIVHTSLINSKKKNKR